MTGRGSVTTVALVVTLLGSAALDGCGAGEVAPSIGEPTAATPMPAATASTESSSPSATASEASSAASGSAVLGDILFVVKPNGEGPDQIWAMTADGSRPLRRIADRGWMPDLSPDGKTIAFASDRAGDTMDIYAMHADGTGAARITGNDFNGFHPRWSPDGATILFSGFPSEVYEVNRDGSGQKQLSADADMASWSPDGSGAGFLGPVWSPAGDRLAFAAETGGPDPFQKDIWVVGLDGSPEVDVSNDPADEDFPTWSPDGGRLAYLRSVSPGSLRFHPVVSAVDAGTGTTLPEVVGDTPMPWSPDGTRILAVELGAGAGSLDRVATIDVATGASVVVIDGHPDGVGAWR
jgi:dipeptidyl aminopeptidase/acylaminoacyl peptidase